MVSLGVVAVSSVAGNALWNRTSWLVPLTLAGQMILFETLFALIYGLLWESRWPTHLEAVAFVLVVASVLSCLNSSQISIGRPLTKSDLWKRTE